MRWDLGEGREGTAVGGVRLAGSEAQEGKIVVVGHREWGLRAAGRGRDLCALLWGSHQTLACTRPFPLGPLPSAQFPFPMTILVS